MMKSRGKAADIRTPAAMQTAMTGFVAYITVFYIIR
jgi:hypothetical protein